MKFIVSNTSGLKYMINVNTYNELSQFTHNSKNITLINEYCEDCGNDANDCEECYKYQVPYKKNSSIIVKVKDVFEWSCIIGDNELIKSLVEGGTTPCAFHVTICMSKGNYVAASYLRNIVR